MQTNIGVSICPSCSRNSVVLASKPTMPHMQLSFLAHSPRNPSDIARLVKLKVALNLPIGNVSLIFHPLHMFEIDELFEKVWTQLVME